METKILYIAGWGRSGSTILSSCLAEIPGYLTIGELNYVWEKLFLKDRRCECGDTVNECPLWSEVFRRLYGGVRSVPVQKFIRLRESLPTNLDILLGKDSLPPDSSNYAEAIGEIYATAAAVAGADVIVDSTKTPTHLNLLREAPNLDIRVVHLVRDPRATARSWMRRKERTDVSESGVFMTTLHPFENCRRYVSCNLTTEALLSRYAIPHTRLRYEDFCRAPATELEETLNTLGLPFPFQPFQNERCIEISTNHTAWGNPGRKTAGEIRIRENQDRKDHLSSRHRWLINLLTLPYLIRYGYAGTPFRFPVY